MSQSGPSGAVAEFNSQSIGYQPEYSAVQSLRKSVRDTLDTLWFEAIVILLVAFYAIIIFIDLTLDGEKGVDPQECIDYQGDHKANATLVELCDLTVERDWLYWLDLVFLSIFMVEIAVRVFGFGADFFRDAIQSIDAFVVTLAFAFALIPEDVMASVSFLNVLRVIRLFRLAVIINKLQRSREAAAMRSKVRRRRSIARPPPSPHRRRRLRRLRPSRPAPDPTPLPAHTRSLRRRSVPCTSAWALRWRRC